MKRDGLKLNRTTRQVLLHDDEVIVLFKKGSRGEVVGIVESVMEIVDTERRFNSKFSSGHIYKCLGSAKNSFTSLRHQCRIKPVIKKREDVKHLI